MAQSQIYFTSSFSLLSLNSGLVIGFLGSQTRILAPITPISCSDLSAEQTGGKEAMAGGLYAPRDLPPRLVCFLALVLPHSRLQVALGG